MRVFLDTNIIISAALYPNGSAAIAFNKAVTFPNRRIVGDYVLATICKGVKFRVDGLPEKSLAFAISL